MTAQEKIQKVTEISQSKGWSISVDDKNKSNIQFDFQRYTNYGQDFNFSAEMKCEDIDTLIADMEQYFEGFARITKPIYGLEMMGTVKMAHLTTLPI